MKSLADSLADSPPGSPARTLAEELGLTSVSPRENLKDAQQARPLTAKQFAKAVLESPEYRAHVWRMVTTDSIPPAVESLLYHYAYGKPADKLKVIDETPRGLENFSPEQLEDRLLELAQRARHIRMNEAASSESDDDSRGDPSIH